MVQHVVGAECRAVYGGGGGVQERGKLLEAGFARIY